MTKNRYFKLKINLKPGNYIIKTEYKGNIVYNKIIVKNIIYAKNLSKKKQKSIKKKIIFKIKGKQYKTITNSKGIASISIKKFKCEKYTIYAI